MAGASTAPKSLPPQDELNRLLRYEPATGKLFWRERSADSFRSDGRCRYWNSQYAGREAFAVRHSEGYLCGYIRKRQYLTQRIIWKMVTGEEPLMIDHCNGNRADNQWTNLRAANGSINTKNAAMRIGNRSGVTGVSWDSVNQKWLAQIASDGRSFNLGRYTDFNEAVIARKAAERVHNYHPNHGRKANRSSLQ